MRAIARMFTAILGINIDVDAEFKENPEMERPMQTMNRCKYFSGSVVLKCAVNPMEDCMFCREFENRY